MEHKQFEQPPFPEVHLFPRLEAVIQAAGRVIKRLVSFCPLEAPDYMSNHYTHPLDTEPTYDSQLSLWD